MRPPGPATIVREFADVDLSGDVVKAINFHGGNLTIHGVNFLGAAQDRPKTRGA